MCDIGTNLHLIEVIENCMPNLFMYDAEHVVRILVNQVYSIINDDNPYILHLLNTAHIVVIHASQRSAPNIYCLQSLTVQL